MGLTARGRRRHGARSALTRRAKGVDVRVLHLTAGNLYGGIESSLLTIARFSAAGAGMEAAFALCFEGRLNDELRAAGVPVTLLGAARLRYPWTVLRARRRLAGLLAREPPDAVICHSCWPHVLFGPVVRGRRRPLAFWAHDRYLGRHWLERWSRWTRPDLILANSHFTQSLAGNLFPGVRSAVIHQPVPPPRPGCRNNRCRVRQELHTPEGTVVIVQACRLERWKGHGLLLDALGRLAGKSGWVCWIAGGVQRPHEAAYLAELRRQATALGIAERVRFLGQRADVPDLLAAADVHCQPNTGPEPFGVAFVEALHAGLPVVTTALGGALEIVDEDCGILVSPGAPDALAAALLRLIRDPDLRARLGARGPERARQVCDPLTQLNKVRAALADAVRWRTTAR
jgi:glycosyltransferase involved in cell wall biosynthesis